MKSIFYSTLLQIIQGKGTNRGTQTKFISCFFYPQMSGLRNTERENSLGFSHASITPDHFKTLDPRQSLRIFSLDASKA